MKALEKGAKEEQERGKENKRMKRGKMMKREVGQRGITLVALVVTIIIMLILAGVALRLALGENGLFKMSEKAVEKYKEAQQEEENALQKGSEELSNAIESLKPPAPIGKEEVTNNLKKYQGKYVDIGLDVDGKDGTTNDWELFYAGNDRIYLIAADYVATEILEKQWHVIGSGTTLDTNGFKAVQYVEKSALLNCFSYFNILLYLSQK